MTIDSVYSNIMQAEKTFRSLIISTYHTKLAHEISWGDYTPGIFKNLYAKEYEFIIRNKQYSFLLRENKGCIQFYYAFNDSKLCKMKLCYYPYPVELKETSADIENNLSDYNDEIIGEYYYDLYNLFSHQFELSLTDEKLKILISESRSLGNFESEESLILGKFEDKYKFTNSSHLRIDYDPLVESHHKCEIQIGSINNIRLPMNKVIMPLTFCDFIFKNIFPTQYKSIKAKSTYPATFTNSKALSVPIKPFNELNIFNSHP
jgi:hypothetical protein